MAKQEPELGRLRPQYVTLHTTGPPEIVTTPTLKLESTDGVLTPKLSEHELDFFARETSRFADIAFLIGNFGKARLEYNIASLFNHHGETVGMVLGEGKVYPITFSVSISKGDKWVRVAGWLGYDFRLPDIAFPPIGLFESDYAKRVSDTSRVESRNIEWRRERVEEHELEVGGLEGIMNALVSNLSAFGIKTGGVQFYSKTTGKPETNIGHRYANGASVTTSDGTNVNTNHFYRSINIRRDYEYPEVDQASLDAGLREVCKTLSASLNAVNRH